MQQTNLQYEDYSDDEEHILDNCIEWLKAKKFIGQLYPDKISEQHLPPMYAVLTPLQTAYDECFGPYNMCPYTQGYKFEEVSSTSGLAKYAREEALKLSNDQDKRTRQITIGAFKKHLRNEGIEIFNSDNDFMKAKVNYNSRKDIMSSITPKLEEIFLSLELAPVEKKAIKYHTQYERVVIKGKNGCIYDDETDPSKIHVRVEGMSKRKLSAIGKKLHFMNKVTSIIDNEAHFTFVTGSDIHPDYAEAIRKAIGLRKKKTYSQAALERLQKGALAARERKGPKVSESALIEA